MSFVLIVGNTLLFHLTSLLNTSLPHNLLCRKRNKFRIKPALPVAKQPSDVRHLSHTYKCALLRYHKHIHTPTGLSSIRHIFMALSFVAVENTSC
jgi:hypothetical protein